METSATGVAGPMPQPSSLPIRLSGEVGGLESGIRGLVEFPAPPKIPPGVGELPVCGSCTPGVGTVAPPHEVGGCGTGGEVPPVVGTADGSIRNTSSS